METRRRLRVGESLEGRLGLSRGKLRIGDVVKLCKDVDDKGENLFFDLTEFSLLLFPILGDADAAADDLTEFSLLVKAEVIFFTGDGDLVCNCNKFSGVIPNCIEVRLEIL